MALLPKVDIEPGILPLVEALNNTGVVHTFSSCQGHFDQFHRFNDKNKADVRFHPEDNISEKEIEKFIYFLLSEFNDKHSFDPVILSAHKLYTPLQPNENEIIDYVYVIELTPFDQEVSPEQKRQNVDQAILYAAKLAAKYGL